MATLKWTLKSLRVTVNLTQKEMASLIGISENSLGNLEKDSTNIKNWILDKYVEIFDISVDDIFLGKEYVIFAFNKYIARKNSKT
ncbi:helix-turn-helix transcriptional regulator [Lactococcus raffinolactis]|uniref:helix-turn-helix transcriptional regulator n=1 Tax=Pseudolactococcus raffinolactis TaxID=1366 RepID=UPI001BB0DEC6|nr:helix-turn-helix transcriptional regulator [Lactococcus raffinolactis]